MVSHTVLHLRLDRFVVASLCAQYAVRIASLRQLIAERMCSWCRLKEFRKCFVNSVLQCIFHTPLLRGIIMEYDSNYNTGSFIVATSTMHCSSLWIAWPSYCAWTDI